MFFSSKWANTASYAFLLFWSNFELIHWKPIILVKKMTISESRTEIPWKVVFLNKFENRQILSKNWICLNNFFDQTSKRGPILTKTVFLLKTCHIQLNHNFLLFWSIFGEIHWKLLFLFKKVTISERSSEILRKIIFLNKFEKEKIQRKIWIWCKQPFLF